MQTCPNCNKTLPDKARFCDACGTKLPGAAACPACGAPAVPGAAFCEQCGKPLAPSPAPAAEETQPAAAEEAAAPAAAPPDPAPAAKAGSDEAETAAPAAPAAKPAATATAAPPAAKAAAGAPAEKKRFPVKALLIGVAALVLVAAAVFAALKLFGGWKKSNFALYLKDDDIVFTSFKKDEAVALTSRLIGSGNADAYEYSISIQDFMAVTRDGSKIFYPEKVDTAASEGVTLYCRMVGKINKEPVKVDSGITNYAVNDDGSFIVYTKGTPDSGYTLYYSDLKAKEKIAGDVSTDFLVSGDCKKAVYVKTDGNCYFWAYGKEPVKISGGVSYLSDAADDLSVIYYFKDGDSLHKFSAASGESEKIASNVRYASVCETGEVYFVRSSTKEFLLSDYIYDDLLESDALITYPERPAYPDQPVYPDWYAYDTYEEYYEAVDQYYNELDAFWDEVNAIDEDYYAALDEYNKKEYRDELRERLKTASYSFIIDSLYYYDGSAETLVAENIEAFNASDFSPIAFVNVYEAPEWPLFTFSGLEEYYAGDYYYSYYGGYSFDYFDDIGDSIYWAHQNIIDSYIAKGASLTQLDNYVSIHHARFTPDGTAAYFSNSVTSSSGFLYKVMLTDNAFGNIGLIDEDVYLFSVSLADNRPVYFAGFDGVRYQGDLYVDGTQIDTDVVYIYPVINGNTIVYLKSGGELMMSKDGEKQRISDDVESFAVTPAGDVVFIKDFSRNSRTGTLYHYSNNKRQKLADEVSCLLVPFKGQIHGLKSFPTGW